MNAIPCTPRHEKQDDTFTSWENLPAGVMASLSQRTVGLDWCSSWCCCCRWCTHTDGTKGERGWIGGKRWLTRPRCWEAVVRVTLANGRRGNCQKVLRKELRIELHALQGCNMSTWRWTWGRNLSVNEGWQDSPPVSFFSDFVRQKKLSPMINAKLPAWFRREAMGQPRPGYNFSPWNRSVEEGDGVQEYYLRSKTCHKGTPKECLPPPLVHFSSLCIFTSLSEPLSV